MSAKENAKVSDQHENRRVRMAKRLMKAAFKQAKAEKAAACPEAAKECTDPANPKKAVLPKDAKTISQPLLAFTFFYSVAIYILLLSFYFWLWRTDIKPEK